MKKLLLIFTLLFSVMFSSNSFAQEKINSIFGIKLFDNLESLSNLVSIENIGPYQNSSEFKSMDIFFRNKLNENPYFKSYYLYTDQNNIIHAIRGMTSIKSMKICKTLLHQITNNIENKFSINFQEKKHEVTLPTGNTVANNYLSQGKILQIFCEENFDNGNAYLDIMLRSLKFENFMRDLLNRF